MLNQEHIDNLSTAIAELEDSEIGLAIVILQGLKCDLEVILELQRVQVKKDKWLSAPALDDSVPVATPEFSRRSHRHHQKRRYSRSNEEFEQFWASVRMKVGKTQARKAFERIEDDVDVDYLIKKLDECQDYFLERHGHLDYMPRPYTWLAMKRWEDDWTVQP